MNNFIELWNQYLATGLIETLQIVFQSTIYSTILGSLIGITLVITRKNGLKENYVIYRFLDVLVNFFRSFPFIVLILFLMPFTLIVMRLLTGVGTTSGNVAVLIPLTIGASPFFARVIENSLLEVNKEVIEASKSLGLTSFQIMRRVIIREALPSIVNGITLCIVSLIGFTAMAGAVGAGGLGAIALTIGLYNYEVLIYSVILIILFVQFVQIIGNIIYKKMK